jgi:D-alanyl-D-alanine carboxypeptidase
MPLLVLQPVKRRRRRRRWKGALGLVILLAVGLAAGWYYGFERADSSHGAAPAPGTTTTPPATTKTQATETSAPPPVPRLVSAGAGLRSHEFPRLGAKGAVLVDGKTGSVLWEERSHRRLPIASTTKIMTATLVLERRSLDHVVRVDPLAARTEPFREGLRPNERVPVKKLLYALLLFSGNDDAYALAVDAAGSREAFLRLMNDKAEKLGLRDTHFSSPSGVRDENNYSSAWDMAGLARYAMRNATFRTIVATREKRVSWPAPTFAKVYVNKNHLLGTYEGADGVKTGWTTKAQHCLVASTTRDGVQLIAVVLGSPDAYKDARRIMNWGFRTRG